MDIFNGNRKLEEVIMYALDWGVFLRHNMDEPITPYMYLFNGDEIQIRVLTTDGDPMEHAKNVLLQEESPFQQFVLGMEGFLRNETNEEIDAIIVQGFDKTQEKGVGLGQMFEPKEMNGHFKKIDRVTFLGQPDLPIELVESENPDYTVEEIGFNAIATKNGEFTKYAAFFTHSNPSMVANSITHFLRAKIGDEDSGAISGRFDLTITPGLIQNDEFLRFLVVNAIEEEKVSDFTQEWEGNTGRAILVNCKHGEVEYYNEIEPDAEESQPDSTDDITIPSNERVEDIKPITNVDKVKNPDGKPWWKRW